VKKHLKLLIEAKITEVRIYGIFNATFTDTRQLDISNRQNWRVASSSIYLDASNGISCLLNIDKFCRMV
jgi:hypothetical protein